MANPVPIGTNRHQAIIDLEEAHTYFVAMFKKDADGDDVFCGYVSALDFAARRKMWGTVQHWLSHDMMKMSLDTGWFEEEGG
jgi:hypothetical protein